jgi:hypothetical protein
VPDSKDSLARFPFRKLLADLMHQGLFGLVEEVLGSEIKKNQKKYETYQREANLRFVVKTQEIPDFQVTS